MARRLYPRKSDETTHPLEEPGANPGYAVEAFEAAKRTVFGPPGDNSLRERGTNAGETRDFRHIGLVEVDALAGQEGAGEAFSRLRALREGVLGGRVDRREPHIPGRGGVLTHAGRQAEADPGADEGQGTEQERGAAVVHAGRVAARL